MKLIDRVLLVPILFFTVYTFAENRLGNVYFATSFALAVCFCLIMLFDRLHDSNFILRSKERRATMRRSTQYVRSFAIMDPAKAASIISGALCSYYNLHIIASDSKGFLAETLQDKKRIYISICLRHPDNGVLSIQDAANAFIDAHKNTADLCALACLGSATKVFSDPYLKKIHILTGNDLAHIFAAKPELIEECIDIKHVIPITRFYERNA